MFEKEQFKHKFTFTVLFYYNGIRIYLNAKYLYQIKYISTNLQMYSELSQICILLPPLFLLSLLSLLSYHHLFLIRL